MFLPHITIMTKIIGTEKVLNPVSQSKLYKKSLCDYVINVTTGCLFGCPHCCVPSTPMIRARQGYLRERGVSEPLSDWGEYVFVRDNLPTQVDAHLSKSKKWVVTIGGQGVVMLCIGCDPYQNKRIGAVTREVVQVLLNHGKRVRLLTRSPLWVKDLDILVHPNITIGMSIPSLDISYMQRIEPTSPPVSSRMKAMINGSEAGARLFLAVAPTTPYHEFSDYAQILRFAKLINNLEIIFWEFLNPRGGNLSRIEACNSIDCSALSSRHTWANMYLNHWELLNRAAEYIDVDLIPKLHLWLDSSLSKYDSEFEYLAKTWVGKKTIERWEDS